MMEMVNTRLKKKGKSLTTNENDSKREKKRMKLK